MAKKSIITLLLIILFILSACGNNETYKEDLQSTQTNLISVGAKSEEMLNLYGKLWSASIDKDVTLLVDKMANALGTSERDIEVYFNVLGDKVINGHETIVPSLRDFYQSNGQIEELEEELAIVKGDIKSLNNPPKEYEEAFDRLLEMYSLTEEIAGLAISPSGSLISFNEKRNQLSNDIIKLNKEIEVLLPED